eukprot:COSAG06_NODE_27334_length_596_cov_1.127016_1_plen_117_part_10
MSNLQLAIQDAIQDEGAFAAEFRAKWELGAKTRMMAEVRSKLPSSTSKPTGGKAQRCGNRLVWSHFVHQNDRFAKTGSGQAPEKSREKARFFLQAWVGVTTGRLDPSSSDFSALIVA